MNDNELINGNPSAPSAPMVDAEEFARSIFAQVAQSQGFAATAQQKNEITAAVDELRAKNFDDDFIDGQLRTALGITKEVDKRIAKTSQDLVEGYKTRETLGVINRAIRDYSKEDELIKVSAETIRTNVVRNFLQSRDPEVAQARSRYNSPEGEVDADVLEALVDKEVNKIWKAAGKEPSKKGGPAIKPSAAQQPSEGSEVSRDSMSDVQGNVYDAHKATLIRYGTAPEEAHKRALAAAQRVKK